MPRLDGTDQYVLDFFCLDEPDDLPIDVCIDCVLEFTENGVKTIEHRPYTPGIDYCDWCGDNLYERDN